MKIFIRIILVSCAFFLLSGCMNKDPTFEPSNNNSLELTKLTAKGITDQQPADQAKEFLSNYEEVSGVRAVNSDGQLVIAVDVYHHDRFSLEHIENELKNAIKKNFSKIDVTLTTDKKLLIELKELEEDITNKKVTKEEIKKRLKNLKSLSEEET